MATDYIKQLLHASSVALYGNEAVTTGDVTFSKLKNNSDETRVNEIKTEKIKTSTGPVTLRDVTVSKTYEPPKKKAKEINYIQERIDSSVSSLNWDVGIELKEKRKLKANALLNETDSFIPSIKNEGIEDTQLKKRKSKQNKAQNTQKSRDFTVSKVTDQHKKVNEGASCIQESVASSVVSLDGDAGINIKKRKKKKDKKVKDVQVHVTQSNLNDSNILMEANSLDEDVSPPVSKKFKKRCKENKAPDASTTTVYGNKAVKFTDAVVTKARKKSKKKVEDAANNNILELIAASMVALYGDIGSKVDKSKKVQDVRGQSLKHSIENNLQAFSKANDLSSDFRTNLDASLEVSKANTMPIEVQYDEAVSDSLSIKKRAKKNKIKQKKDNFSESHNHVIHNCSQASISSNKKKRKENSKPQKETNGTVFKDDLGNINSEIFITESLPVKEETILPDQSDDANDLDYDQLVEGDPLDLNSSYDSLVLGVTGDIKENSEALSVSKSPLLNPLFSESGSRSSFTCSTHPSPDLKIRSPILKTLKSVSPDDKVRSLISKINFPSSRSSTPVSEKSSPLSKNQTPQSRSRSPVSKNSSPPSRSSSSNSRISSSLSRNHTSQSRSRSPQSRSNSPRSRSHSPRSRSRSPQSRSRSPQSRSQSPQSRSRSPQSRSRSPQSRSRNPQSRSRSPQSRSRSPQSRSRSPRSRSRSPRSRSHSPQSRSRSPQSRSSSPQARNRSPRSRSRSSGSRSISSQSRSLSPESRSRSPQSSSRSPQSRSCSPQSRSRSPQSRSRSPQSRSNSPESRYFSPVSNSSSPKSRSQSHGPLSIATSPISGSVSTDSKARSSFPKRERRKSLSNLPPFLVCGPVKSNAKVAPSASRSSGPLSNTKQSEHTQSNLVSDSGSPSSLMKTRNQRFSTICPEEVGSNSSLPRTEPHSNSESQHSSFFLTDDLPSSGPSQSPQTSLATLPLINPSKASSLPCISSRAEIKRRRRSNILRYDLLCKGVLETPEKTNFDDKILPSNWKTGENVDNSSTVSVKRKLSMGSDNLDNGESPAKMPCSDESENGESSSIMAGIDKSGQSSGNIKRSMPSEQRRKKKRLLSMKTSVWMSDCDEPEVVASIPTFDDAYKDASKSKPKNIRKKNHKFKLSTPRSSKNQTLVGDIYTEVNLGLLSEMKKVCNYILKREVPVGLLNSLYTKACRPTAEDRATLLKYCPNLKSGKFLGHEDNLIIKGYQQLVDLDIVTDKEKLLIEFAKIQQKTASSRNILGLFVGQGILEYRLAYDICDRLFVLLSGDPYFHTSRRKREIRRSGKMTPYQKPRDKRNVSRVPWKCDEDKQLLEHIMNATNSKAVQDMVVSKTGWEMISEKMGRPVKLVRSHWLRILKPMLVLAEKDVPDDIDFKIKLFEAILEMDVKCRKEIDWVALEKRFLPRPSQALQNAYSGLAYRVDLPSHNEILQHCLKNLRMRKVNEDRRRRCNMLTDKENHVKRVQEHYLSLMEN